ncbi:unnamed protein product [Wuchereria bancrofti]|uniref:Uncharacterized protein n=1 Tax=Wuchereria bancrofti TaxID=6293 RepID=A0A3P7DKR0_WUCBA|nr:unnamed protein product [Wuchereria bancrofti]
MVTHNSLALVLVDKQERNGTPLLVISKVIPDKLLGISNIMDSKDSSSLVISRERTRPSISSQHNRNHNQRRQVQLQQ